MEPLKCCMMVNHDEQITVYEQIARKLGLVERYGEVVYKPTSFINRHSVDEPIDVAFIDEAHLLLTQGKQSYQGENQLRIRSSKEIVKWIDDFTKKRKVSTVPKNCGGYEIRIFESPLELEHALKEKAEDKNHKL